MSRIDIDNLLSELGVASPSAPREGSPTLPPRQPAPQGPADPVGPPEALTKRRAPILQSLGADATEPARPAPHTPGNPSDTLTDILYEPDGDAGEPPEQSEIGAFLVARGAVTAAQLTAAQTILKQSPGRRLTELLVEQGGDEALILQAVGALKNLPFERIDLEKGLDGGFDGKLLQRLTSEFCKRHMVMPLRIAEGAGGTRLVLGATRPDDVFLLDEVRRKLAGAGIKSIKLVLVTAFDIRGALEIVGETEHKEENVDISALLSEVEETDVSVDKGKSDNEVDLEKEAAESPVIKYVNYIIQTAVKEGASDIHIEPADKKLKVRFRIDGELYETMNPPASMGAAITSRLKIMANLDIAERRLPQDGRIRCTVQGRKLDLRLSSLPTGYGEKIVMRILDTRSINVGLEELGFDESTLTIWKKQVESPHGIVLVTGPTGSGKTTTLYSSLRQIDKGSMNVSTVEDPIEYHLEGITQTQTHEKIGMSFAIALRALLRQDPDVIMLGEIRDHETAHIAVQAALTGHLVLSTLHTNDAPSSITRLVNIGLEPFLVGAAINAVLAQRLIRRLCTHCKVQGKPTDERCEFLELNAISAETVYLAKGCDRCRNTGYSGRVGLYELLAVDDQLRDIIARNPNVAEFRRLCIERGMNTLRQDGLAKVARGMTTVEEVLRVTESH
ncbi:MAG: Flp pilus assembly complex ATPase component TadA [Phycisphaerales bacterium]|nr:Flp pilus assembly complex ATPase component TadA [Phycisphaerales bacterium]